MPAGNVVLFSSARGARVAKMATTQEKAFRVIQHGKTNSLTSAQREFRKHYHNVSGSQGNVRSLRTKVASAQEEFY